MSQPADALGNQETDIAASGEPAPTGLGPAPRELSPRVRSKAWREPNIRFWWLAALAFFAIGAYFVVGGWLTWRHESMLVENGVSLDATLVEVTYLSQPLRLPGKSFDPSNLVRIEFPWHGEQHTTRSMLASGHKGFVIVGQTVQVRVNPRDPDDWTELTESEPLLHRILGGLIPLPIALVAFLGSWWMRRRLLRIWRSGPSVHALVIESRHSAVALRSRRVRCTPAAEGDARVFTVYVPSSAERIAEGDLLWVIAAPDHGSSAIAVDWIRD